MPDRTPDLPAVVRYNQLELAHVPREILVTAAKCLGVTGAGKLSAFDLVPQIQVADYDVLAEHGVDLAQHVFGGPCSLRWFRFKPNDARARYTVADVREAATRYAARDPFTQSLDGLGDASGLVLMHARALNADKIVMSFATRRPGAKIFRDFKYRSAESERAVHVIWRLKDGVIETRCDWENSESLFAGPLMTMLNMMDSTIPAKARPIAKAKLSAIHACLSAKVRKVKGDPNDKGVPWGSEEKVVGEDIHDIMDDPTYKAIYEAEFLRLKENYSERLRFSVPRMKVSVRKQKETYVSSTSEITKDITAMVSTTLDSIFLQGGVREAEIDWIYGKLKGPIV